MKTQVFVNKIHNILIFIKLQFSFYVSLLQNIQFLKQAQGIKSCFSTIYPQTGKIKSTDIYKNNVFSFNKKTGNSNKLIM